MSCHSADEMPLVYSKGNGSRNIGIVKNVPCEQLESKFEIQQPSRTPYVSNSRTRSYIHSRVPRSISMSGEGTAVSTPISLVLGRSLPVMINGQLFIISIESSDRPLVSTSLTPAAVSQVS